MKPKTREQNFLAKIAGDTNADLTMVPRTAEEYFLNQIAENGGGGGSSLPSYTSADKGKFLGLGEGSTPDSVEPKWEAASGGGATVITIGQRTGVGNAADYAFYDNGTEVEGYDNCANFLSAIGDVPIMVTSNGLGAKCTVVQKDSSSVLFFFSDDYSTATLKSAGFVEDFH